MTNSEVLNIKVTSRETGRRGNKKVRNSKNVPTVIYGPELKENIMCSIDLLSVERFGTKKHESTIFQISESDVKEAQSLRVLFKSVSTDPVTNMPIHVDLYALDMTAAIRVPVEISIVGEAIGVKEQGGLLTQTLREVEIECAPNKIPEKIEVDVTALELNGSIHVSDMTFPEGVKAITTEKRTVVTVTAPKAEKEETPADAAPAEGEAAAAPAEGDKKE